MKDLSLLGRDINKTIIIDNISDNFILQPDNGIFISTWYDDMRDRFLDEITPLLCEIVEKKVPDVRRALRTYRDQVLRQVSNGKTQPNIVFQWGDNLLACVWCKISRSYSPPSIQETKNQQRKAIEYFLHKNNKHCVLISQV